MHRYLILIALLLASCSQKKNTVDSTTTQHAYFNSEKLEALEDETKEIKATAESYQSQIQSVLKGAALMAYKADRKAFSDWYEYQEVVSSEVISEIWDSYYGGTAGRSFELKHLHDIAEANAAEQKSLHEALTNKGHASFYTEPAGIESIKAAKERLMN